MSAVSSRSVIPTDMREIGLPPEPVPPKSEPKKAANTMGVSTLMTNARRSRTNSAMSLRTNALNAVRVELMCRAAYGR